MFLETADRLLSRGFAGTFILAGAGPLENTLRARYASGRIVFLGYRNDVPAILASSAASVICSESEAFPFAAIESLAVGTPVVSTDCGGTAEIIRTGRNGSFPWAISSRFNDYSRQYPGPARVLRPARRSRRMPHPLQPKPNDRSHTGRVPQSLR